MDVQLVFPGEDFVKGKPTLRWDVVQVSSSAPSLMQAIEEKLREEDWLVYEWSPVHLRNMLKQWYLKDGVTEVSALKVWQDTCHYLYLPRLVSDSVFRNVIAQGVESEDYFGFASGKEGERYLGFSFGRSSIASLDDSALLIDREAASAYAERLRQASESTLKPEQGEQPSAPPAGTTSAPPRQPAGVKGAGTASPARAKKRFYGTISLDPIKAKMDFSTIIDEVVEQFTAKVGVDVRISVEIEASSEDGFDDALQRTIKENCGVLRFGSAEFEDD